MNHVPIILISESVPHGYIIHLHTFGHVVFKSRNSMSIMNFPGNGTPISHTKLSLLLRSLSFISTSVWKR